MHRGHVESRTDQEPSAAFRLAERWADYAKAAAIYPEANVRVRTALETLQAAADAALAAAGGRPVEVLFHRGALALGGGEAHPLASGTPLAWLHDRIHHAALAGVRFEGPVREAPFAAFTRRLLALYGRGEHGRSFEQLWPETYDGLALVDRRFAGAFVDDEDAEGGPLRSWGEAGGVAIDTTREDDVVEHLLEDPAIRDAFEALGRRVAEVTREGEATVDVDLLGRIVRQLPVDVMRDPAQVRMVAVTALERLGLELDDLDAAVPGGALALRQDVEMSRLLFEASQGLLGRTEDPDNHLPELRKIVADSGAGVEAAPSARESRDAAVLDRAEDFLADLADLPAPWDGPFDADTIGRKDEQVGVHLHVLANADRPENAAVENRAVRGLGRLLERPRAEEVRVVLQYLDVPKNGADDGWKERRRRVAGALVRAGVPPRLRTARLLTDEDALETFPRRFGLYLDSLQGERDGDALIRVAERLGPKRILAAREALVETEGILEAGRPETLLHRPHRALLPFVRLFLESGDVALAARARDALGTIYARDPVGGLLRLSAGTSPPAWYLEALADGAFEGIAAEGMRARVAAELARRARDRDLPATQRVAAIGALGHFQTPDAVFALTDLANARRLLVLPRESKPIRRAAREALRTAAIRRRIDRVS